MSWIIVIEENETLAHQIEEALAQIDAQINVVHFLNSKEFMAWMNLLAQQDPAARARIPSIPFRGIITAIESWNFRDVKLINKFRQLFINMGFASANDELCVLLTGYNVDHSHQKRFEQRSINNLLHKPFDRTLLKQMLEIALTGRHPVKKFHIHNLKTEVQIEMLKEIRITELTEIGFQTLSDQPIDKNHIAKYYASFLETSQHKSALASAFEQTAVEGSNRSRVKLGFFALDQQQSFNLQKRIQDHKQTRPLEPKIETPLDFEFVFVTHESTNLAEQIIPSIERFFNHPLRTFKTAAELVNWSKTSPRSANPSLQRLIFIDSKHLAGNEFADLQVLHKQIENLDAALYILSPRIFPEALEYELSQICEDIYYATFNRSYIIKTLKRAWPSMRTKENIFETHAPLDEIIHVSNPVKVIEVSEAGLVMEYYRELSIGSFRDFVFWMPNEIAIPWLLAQCNCSEYNPSTKTYTCHFVFFGLSDLQQKHIRLWMLHNYIDAKTEAA